MRRTQLRLTAAKTLSLKLLTLILGLLQDITVSNNQAEHVWSWNKLRRGGDMLHDVVSRQQQIENSDELRLKVCFYQEIRNLGLKFPFISRNV